MSYHEFTTWHEREDGTETEIIVGYEHEPADPSVGFDSEHIALEGVTTKDGKPVDLSPEDEARIEDAAWDHYATVRPPSKEEIDDMRDDYKYEEWRERKMMVGAA